MPSYPASLQSLDYLGVVSGSLLSGLMMSLSLIAVPVFLQTAPNSTTLLSQWKLMYSYGFPVLPTFSIGTCGLYILTALSRRVTGQAWIPLLGAAGVSIGMIPFTWVFLWPTNGELERLYASRGEVKAEEERWVRVKMLVGGWRWRHLVRSLFPLAGAIVAAKALKK
ncbi:Anthrone oxygenase-like protein [Elsinoe fawcettii]|nr:Anthrone oxygenase-like protein [Elsinoe fawcettii]